MTTPLTWPDTHPECPKPRRGDVTDQGQTPTSLRQALRTRRLFVKTQRLMKKQQWAQAGDQVVAAPGPGLTGVEVSAERHGLRWHLSLADLPQRSMFALGGFDDALVAWIIRQLRPHDVVADIGAHVGLLSVQFANRLRALGGGAVLSFEPAPDSAERLRSHIAINDLDNYVTVTQAAVGEHAGTAQLRAVAPGDTDDPSLRTLFGSGDLVAGDVEVLRFDDWWAAHSFSKLDVVKIDVEGGELAVARGMHDTLRQMRPRLLIVEIKEHLSAHAGVETTEVVRDLSRLGYTNEGPFSLVAGRRPAPHLDENFIFTRSHAS